mgnify:CR=1 FL=1
MPINEIRFSFFRRKNDQKKKHHYTTSPVCLDLKFTELKILTTKAEYKKKINIKHLGA